MIHHNNWKYYTNILCGKILKSVISLLKQSLKVHDFWWASQQLHENYFPFCLFLKISVLFSLELIQQMVPVHPVSWKALQRSSKLHQPHDRIYTFFFFLIYKITSFSPILLHTEPSISMPLMLFAFSNKTNSNILVPIQDANSLGCKPDFFNSIKRELNFN